MTPRKETTVTKKKKRVPEKTRHHVGLEQRIRERAYELFQQRGGEHGHDLDDWLQAEAEILDRKISR